MPERPASPESPKRWGDAVRLPELAAATYACRKLLRGLTRPGRRATPSPLVLHGPPGVGKTLLVQSLARKLAADPAGLTARVLAARDWPSDADELPELAAADLVCVEDLQYLPPRAAGELESLLDRRAARRRPTVATASTGPAELELPRRLGSRLSAGLVVPVPALGPDSRRVLVALHAARRRVPLAPDALDWLAERPTGGGVRPTLGLVERLAVLARGAADPLSAAAAERLLADGESLDQSGDPAPAEAIIRRVARAFGVTPRELLSPSRLPATLLPRQVAMTLTRERLGLSLPKLGHVFGGRDHTTVLHACRKVAARCELDPAFAALVEQLRGEIR